MKNTTTSSAHDFIVKNKPTGLYLLATIAGAIIVISMIYLFRTGSRMVAVYASQIHATMEIKLELTEAHLWFEEVVSGDTEEEIEVVWELLDSADWYAKALLQGDQNQEGVFLPFKDKQLRDEVDTIRTEIAQFRQISNQRLQDAASSRIGSQIDQQYDNIYRQVISDVDILETSLQKSIHDDLKRFRTVQVVLIAVSIALIAFVAIGFNYFITRHLNDEQELLAANQQLQASEQQLRAANQQLQAGEQQLRAANQQLQATEQQLRAANQQLAAREKELQLLFKQMTSGFAVHEIICDEEGKPYDYRFLDLNPAFEQLTGLQKDAVVGKTAKEIMPTIDDFWIDTYGKVALTGTPDRFEHYSKELDRYFDVAAFMPHENQFAVIFNNITERKRAEKQTARLNKILAFRNKELQSIVYAASHDLRSPLVNIQGFGGELSAHCEELRNMIEKRQSSEELPEELRSLINDEIPEALQFIQVGTGKMQTLLDGLLDVSRIGTIDVKPAKLDMKKLLDSVIAATKFQIDELDAKVTLGNVPPCIGDASQIDQVFSNLLNNAIKYLSPDRKGRISIEGYVENQRSVYCVKDNGIGIAPEHQDKIFEIFHRLNPRTSPPGEGLGLTIISRILDRLDGQIWVKSEPDKGSSFFVSLPTA